MQVKASLLGRDAFIFQKSKIIECITCILDNTSSDPNDAFLPHRAQGSDLKPIVRIRQICYGSCTAMYVQCRVISCFGTSLLQLQLYGHAEEYDKAFAFFTPWELNGGVDVASVVYRLRKTHCSSIARSSS